MDRRELENALERAVSWTNCYIDAPSCCYDCTMRYALLKAMIATLERHAPFADVLGMLQCRHESSHDYVPWPCADVLQIIDQLEWLASVDGRAV